MPAAGTAQPPYQPTMLLTCTVDSPGSEWRLHGIPEVEVLHKIAPTVVEVLVRHPSDVVLLKSLGYQPLVVHSDLEAFYASRLQQQQPVDIPKGSMGGYLTFAEILLQLDLWRQKYPKLITARQSLGKTLESRDLWIVKVSDNADTDENEPEIFVETLIHCREPAGLMSMMRCVEYLLENYGKDPMVTDLVDNREIWYLPVANPDGYEYNQSYMPNGGGMWRKNRWKSGSTVYGVDLNRNWAYKWGYDNQGSSSSPRSSTYRGTGPFSELETQSISTFIDSRKTKGMTTAWDIHTYSALLMWPYGYANVLSPRHNAYSEMVADMVAENNFIAGPIYSTIYAANGTTVDWFEGSAGLWGWTPEIGHKSGDGFWPPTNRIWPLAEENLHMLLTGIQYAGPYLVTRSTAVKEVGNNNGAHDPGEKIDVTCVVRNRGAVTASGAVVKIESASPYIVIEVGMASLGNIPNVTNADNNSKPLRVRLLESTPPGSDLLLHLVYDFNGHVLKTPLNLTCGAGNVLVNDTCEAGTWTLGVPGDTAVRGMWAWGDPYATYATSNNKFLVQTGDDHTTGTGRFCYVTGNTNTSNGDSDDVDGGKTTLMTPVLDLSSARNPYIEYWRWYMDHGPVPNNDALVVSVTNDNGTTWKEVEKVTYSDMAWRRFSFKLRDFFKPTNQVRLRFVASDDPDDSFCEALVDDLKVTDYDDGVRITLGGSTRIGQTALIHLTATRSASRPYVVAVALLDEPGFPVAGPRTVPLNPDPLFYTFWSLPGIFQNFVGTLGGSGTGQAQVAIPDNAGLVGATFFAAFLTLDPTAPAGLRDISPSLAVTITAKD